MESEQYQRVLAAANLEVPDRIPWSIWAHYPAIPWLKHYSWELANRNGEHQAKAHLALLRSLDYKMDLLKVTPFFRSMAYRWGSKFQFRNNTGKDEEIDVVVKEPVDWEKLWVLDPRKELRENLRCIEYLSRDLRNIPFIYSISSPMTQALHGISTPETVHRHIKEHPGAVRKGLETINETNIEFMKSAVEEGCHGFFYGIAGRGDYWSRFNKNDLEEWTLQYDKDALESIDAPLKMLHICNTLDENPERHGELMSSGWFEKYPVNILNWWDHHFTPLSQAKKVFKGRFCLAGGLDHKLTLTKSPEEIEKEAIKAIKDAKEGGGFILAGGCTVTSEAPVHTYNTVAKVVMEHGVYKK
jgi:uroporphyrinogen-III decarboxylase